MIETRVMVLGSGPAGLMAAHAAAMEGCDVRIFSKDARKSYMKGAQYLHAPIPGASRAPAFTVRYELNGTPTAYRRKVYGNAWDKAVSPEDLVGEADAWDIREAYDWLWDTYGSYVTPVTFDSARDVDALLSHWKPQITISTIPAQLLCLERHEFKFETIYSTDRSVLPKERGDNLVVCDGTDDVGWYRAARIHGHETVEWPAKPGDPKPPFKPMWEVPKPLSTTCDCMNDVLRMGRYGRWQKGVLSHEAFYQTADFVKHYSEQGRLF